MRVDCRTKAAPHHYIEALFLAEYAEKVCRGNRRNWLVLRLFTGFSYFRAIPKPSDMTFEIPIDRETAIGQYRLRLNRTFKKNLSRNSLNIISAGVILFLAWLMISDKKNLGYIFLSLGLFYLFNALHYFRYYVKISRKYKRIYHDMVLLREKHNDTSIWRFESDVFEYKDMHYDYSIKWEAFKGYQVVDSNLFLQLAEAVDQSFIIGEGEIGEQPFAEVISFVDGKLKNLGESAIGY